MTPESTLNQKGRFPAPISKGQSLVEFVLVMPILVLILIGGFSFGMGTYEAHMLSDAIQGPAGQKLLLSDNLNAIDTNTLQAMMNSTGLSGNFNTGALVESVVVQNVPNDPYTSVMVGTKTYVPGASFIPGFDIHVGQVINRNLLEAAYTGGQKRPLASTTLPAGIVANAPPWE